MTCHDEVYSASDSVHMFKLSSESVFKPLDIMYKTCLELG